MTPFGLAFDAPPHRLSGTVVGVAVSRQAALDALGDALHAAPYRAPPKAVVLYVKPRNTFVAVDGLVEAADDGALLEAGATLGIVIGRTARAVDAASAPQHVAGYLVAADFSLPVAGHYRPQVRLKARDASLVVSRRLVAPEAVGDADALGVRVFVDGALAHESRTGPALRTVPELVAAVSAFMTLAPGDLLLAGVAPGAPRVGAGARVAVEIDRVGRLEARLAARGAAA